MYDTVTYANSRLADTIVRTLDGDPIRILGCTGRNNNIKVVYSLLLDAEEKTCSLNDIDITPVSLGNCFTKQGLSYLTRMPKRRDYRQGLRYTNYLSVYGVDHRYVSNRDLYKTIKGIYFDFEHAIEEAVNLDVEVPFNREFYISPLSKKGTLYLGYKWFGKVGDIVNNEPMLYEKTNHLQEALEDAINVN